MGEQNKLRSGALHSQEQDAWPLVVLPRVFVN